MSESNQAKDNRKIEGTEEEEPKPSGWSSVRNWLWAFYDKVGYHALVLGGIISLLVYISGWWEGNPTITATILSNDPLLLQGIDDPKVEIFVDGKPGSKPENISVLRIRVQNESKIGIGDGEKGYDNGTPFGVVLEGYRVLGDPYISEASSEVLREAVEPSRGTISKRPAIQFQKVMLNGYESFTVQALVERVNARSENILLWGKVLNFHVTGDVQAEAKEVPVNLSQAEKWGFAGLCFALIFIWLMMERRYKQQDRDIARAMNVVRECASEIESIATTMLWRRQGGVVEEIVRTLEPAELQLGLESYESTIRLKLREIALKLRGLPPLFFGRMMLSIVEKMTEDVASSRIAREEIRGDLKASDNERGSRGISEGKEGK